MSRPPSESRIAIWERRATMLDTHFGYHHLRQPEEGPCSMTVEYLTDAYRRGQIPIMHVETFFEAVEAVKAGTRVNDFLPNRENCQLDCEFDLFLAEIEDSAASFRDCITEELREQYLRAVFTAPMHALNQLTINRCHERLETLVERETEHSASWGAMYLALRIYESMLVHLGYYDEPTRKRIENCFKGDQGSKKRTLYCRKARSEALVSIHRWQSAVGIEPSVKSQRPPAKPIKPKTTFTVIRGGKT